jgi:antirestriction protein ArdC
MQTETRSPNRDLYRSVTDKIVAAIEAGAGIFQMPWHFTGRPACRPLNAHTHAAYRGINILSLWVDAEVKGYTSGLWASYKQWQSLGAQVRSGERGSLIIFYKPLPAPEEEAEDSRRYVTRASYVFNVAQVSGYQETLELPVSQPLRHETADAFIAATGARIRHGFHVARYRRDLDDIEMPSAAWFTGTKGSTSTEAYYATVLHELTHWSGATHRLDREFGKRFADHAYAFEELVAELGAAFLCAELGIANEPRPDHAAYLAHWLAIFKQDPRSLFTAAGKAQEAAEYLTALVEHSG